MKNKKYYSYDPCDSFEFHETEEAAKAAYQDAMDRAEDSLRDGDASDMEHEISWGKVCQSVGVHDRPPTPEEKAGEPDWDFIRTLSTEDHES